MFDPAHDWPIYIFMAIFFGFIAYVIIVGRKNQDKGNDEDVKPKDGPPKLPR